MIPKSLDQVTEEDLQALIDNKVIEHKSIEYKKTLPGNPDKAKKEFLADVSSFVNAGGGDLIYGIVEDRETGTPKSLDGLNIENVDQEILRLDNMIRTGIQPRIPSVRIQPVELKNSKYVLIIRVRQSWIGPHRVIFNKDYQFYSRNSNGKHPLDVAELRVAFNLSETITERIRKFREDRLAKIIANETPVPFCDNAKIVLHLIPIISFNPAQRYDIGKITSNPGSMLPIGFQSGGFSYRYNLDGFLTYLKDQYGKSSSYVQLFRSGIIEAVEGWWLRHERSDGKKLLYGDDEKELIKSFTEYLLVLKTLSVELPVFVFLTLLGVKGYSMAVDTWPGLRAEVHIIDRDILELPEVIVENYDEAAEKILKPCFDSIWNACGFPRSFNYNDAGEWTPR